MVSSLVSLLITVLVVGLLCYLIFWAMNYLGASEPFRKVVTVIVVVLVSLWLLSHAVDIGRIHIIH